MKKLREIVDKYLVHIGVVLMLGMGSFLWDYVTRFIDAPRRIERLEERLEADSVVAVRWKKGVDSALKTHQDFLRQDWDSLVKFSREINN